MSHIEKCSVVVADLEALETACKRLGAQLLRDVHTYRWYGRSVGDTPLPDGFTANDLGKCDHVIKVPGVNYEIGVVRNRVGKGYSLLYDFWGVKVPNSPHDGHKLLEKFGQGLTTLIDRYSVETLKRQARAKGYTTEEKTVGKKTVLTVTAP